MEILIGLIPFVVFALIWFGIKRFTKFTHDDIFWGLMLGMLVILAVASVLAMAYLIGTAILNGVTIA